MFRVLHSHEHLRCADIRFNDPSEPHKAEIKLTTLARMQSFPVEVKKKPLVNPLRILVRLPHLSISRYHSQVSFAPRPGCSLAEWISSLIISNQCYSRPANFSTLMSRSLLMHWDKMEISFQRPTLRLFHVGLLVLVWCEMNDSWQFVVRQSQSGRITARIVFAQKKITCLNQKLKRNGSESFCTQRFLLGNLFHHAHNTLTAPGSASSEA